MPAVGETLLHYRLEAVVGSGGNGQVFRAYDTRLRRRVAIKVLRPDRHAGAEGQQADAVTPARRMMREARAVAALHHPNVVAVYDVG